MRRYQAEGTPLGALFVFAHGAGAGHDHPFMVAYARELAARGIDVMTFNFPYIDAKRKVPDRAPTLEAHFHEVVTEARDETATASHALFLGGKSMGGRIATHLAAQGVKNLRGVIVLGYPLHPPGKPEQLRVQHLPQIQVPVLIVQGERDAFGTPADIEPYALTIPGGATVQAVEAGDHSLSVRGRKPEQTREQISAAIVAWIARIASSSRS